MIIRYQKLNFLLKALQPLRLPPYKGSTFRGGFGNAFKKVVCIFRNKECRSCPVVKECAYAYIFESLSTGGPGFFCLDKYETVPHPFIIEPPQDQRMEYEKDSEISFSLILIGRAIDYLLYFIMAFEYLGEIGIGQGRGKYELSRVEIDGNPIYERTTRKLEPSSFKTIEIPEQAKSEDKGEKQLTLELITPIRIKYQREFATRLEFHILVTNLLRRIALLNFYYGENRKPEWDHKRLIEEAKLVMLEKSEVSWTDWERYSHRQKVKMKLGGLTGKVVYKGQLEEFIPLLKAGEILHVGKGTSFGLGKYRIEENG